MQEVVGGSERDVRSFERQLLCSGLADMERRRDHERGHDLPRLAAPLSVVS